MQRDVRRSGTLPAEGNTVPRPAPLLRLDADRCQPEPQGDSGPARSRHHHRDDGYLRTPLPRRRRSRPRGNRRYLRDCSGGTGTELGNALLLPSQVSGLNGGAPACRPGSVRPLARGGGHPSGTAVADSLVRPTREHRAGRPQSLAQGTTGSPLDLAPGGVYRAAAVTCGAGGLLHRRFTLTSACRGGGLFSVALSRGSPRVGVTDHPALWSPDLPRRACARRDRPADSPRHQDTPRATSPS